MSDLDLLVTGGCQLDLDTGATDPVTVGVKDGRIAHLGRTSPMGTAGRTLDVDGALVLPGLIDLHTHVHTGVRLGVDADTTATGSGVTTWVDAGTSGAGTVGGFVRHVAEWSRVRIIPFLNLSYLGLASSGLEGREVGELEDVRFADLDAIARVAEELPGVIRGIALRASVNACGANGPVALRLARAAADLLDVPLMVELGMAPPTLTELLPYLREGDVLTACFQPYASGCIVDAEEKLRPGVLEAIERGIRLDVGHGMASMSYRVANAALDVGVLPDTISSDIHSQSITAGVPNLLAVLETFLGLGLPLHEVIRRCTLTPSRTLRDSELGRLTVGGIADIAVLAPEDFPGLRRDATGETLELAVRLRHVATVAGGRVLGSPLLD